MNVISSFRLLKKTKHRLFAFSSRIVEELLRFFLMTVALRLAAKLLSRETALRIANWCGSGMLCIPSSRRPALKSMEIAFGLDARAAKLKAREYLSQPFRAYVIVHRVLHGRESIDDWKIHEDQSEEVDQFRKSGRSFIIATGHFARHIAYAIYFPKITPGLLMASVGPTPKLSLSPAVMRTRLQYKQYLEGIQYCRKDIDLLVAGSSRAGRALLNGLKSKGVHAIVTADAFWNDPDGGIRRPFIGKTCHNFATGAATLGRLAQCPVIPCAPYLDEQGAIVLQWGPTIHPPSRTDKAADLRNTNTIIDFLEKAIARHPSQYVLPIGDQRQWNSACKLWEESDGKESANKKNLQMNIPSDSNRDDVDPVINSSSRVSTNSVKQTRKARPKGVRVEWPDRNTIEDALRELPENPDWPGLFQVLLEPRGPEKRTGLVLDRDGPMGIVLLRLNNHSSWDLVTNWLIPGFLFPVRPGGYTYTVLEALRLRVNVGWWRYPEQEPTGPAVRNFQRREKHEIDCSTDLDSYWKQSGNLSMIRKAQRRCQDFVLKINPEGGAEWTVRHWEEKWRSEPNISQPGLEDRIATVKLLEKSGHHKTHLLYDGDTPIAGQCHLMHKDCVVMQLIYRDPKYNYHGVGTYLMETVFRWAVQAGYKSVDLGAGHAYKNLWAPVAGYTGEFTMEPVERRLSRNSLRWIKRKWSQFLENETIPV